MSNLRSAILFLLVARISSSFSLAQEPPTIVVPSTEEIQLVETTDPAEWRWLVKSVARSFELDASGQGGVALLPEYEGKKKVLRTHPVSQDVPATLQKTLSINRPFNNTKEFGEQRSYLLLSVAPHPDGDWKLQVRGNSYILLDKVINKEATKNGWVDLKIDISRYHGKEVKLSISNVSNDGKDDFAYWGKIEFVTEIPVLEPFGTSEDPKGKFKFQTTTKTSNRAPVGQVIEIESQKVVIDDVGIGWTNSTVSGFFSKDGSHIAIISRFHDGNRGSPTHFEKYWVYSLEDFGLTDGGNSKKFLNIRFADDSKKLIVESTALPEISGK